MVYNILMILYVPSSQNANNDHKIFNFYIFFILTINDQFEARNVCNDNVFENLPSW